MKFSRVTLLFLALLLLPFFSAGVFADETEDAPAALKAPAITLEQKENALLLSWVDTNEEGTVQGYAYLCYPKTQEGEFTENTWNGIHCEEAQPYKIPLSSPLVYGETYVVRLKAIGAIGEIAAESPEASAELFIRDPFCDTLLSLADTLREESFAVSPKDAPDRDTLSAFLKQQIERLNASVEAEVVVTKFSAARGSTFTFSVTLSPKGDAHPSVESITVTDLEGAISSAPQLPAPTIRLETAESGGLSYTITPEGTAEEKDTILNYKITICNAVTGKAVISGYTVTETQGVLTLSADLKGDISYCARVKAVSANSKAYLDSKISEDSDSAKAGRIPVVIRPKVTLKTYGESDPVFDFIVVSPDALPEGLSPSVTITRKAGEDAGLYAFYYETQDTNFAVTMQQTSFEIQKRHVTLRPADRAVKFEKGNSYLPDTEAQVVKGSLCSGHVAALTFDENDAKTAVGEFAVKPTGFSITQDGKDVSENYVVTLESGKLSIKNTTVAEEQKSDAFPIWILFLILALVLLVIAGVIVFFVLRKKSTPEVPEDAAQTSPPIMPEPSVPPTLVPEIPVPPVHDHTESYDELLESLDLGSEEKIDEGEFIPKKTSPDVMATLEEIENAQLKTMEEE